MFFRGIFEELMFNLRGQTDNTILQKKNIHIWDGNTTREFLDSRGLNDLPEGDLGHTYGFSLRHRGAKYMNCKTDYAGQGYDQLMTLIHELKTNPDSRRLIIDLWEPEHMHRASLPPCVYSYQFYTHTDDEKTTYLSCVVTQRSNDLFLAGGWNVAYASLLTYLLASVCNMKPHTLTWNVGDVHIYKTHLEAVREQLERSAYKFPQLRLNNPPENITDFNFENVELLGYKYHPAIKGEMSV
jgi:thymidylate synthase